MALLIPASSSTTTIDWCWSTARAFILYNPISSRTSILRNPMQPAENLTEVKSGRYCTLVQERESRGASVEGREMSRKVFRFRRRTDPSEALWRIRVSGLILLKKSPFILRERRRTEMVGEFPFMLRLVEASLGFFSTIRFQVSGPRCVSEVNPTIPCRCALWPRLVLD